MKPRTQLFISCALVTALALLLAMKLYAQYRPIKIYVSTTAPMPTELANGLHMEEHGINPIVRIESPYENSETKIPSLDEIRRIRSQLVWRSAIPLFIDSLTIESSNKILVRRTTSSVMQEYQLVKIGDRWTIESSIRSKINRAPK